MSNIVKLTPSAEGRGPERNARLVLQALPAAIYTTDPQGRLTFYNDAAAELWGWRPELGVQHWCGSWRLFRLDGSPLPHDECPMAVALKERRPVRGEEAVAERPDGTRVRFAPFPTPLFDAAGEFTGAVNLLVDVTGRRATEAALRDSEELNRRVLESSQDCIKLLDIEGRLLSLNDVGLRVLEVEDFEKLRGARYPELWAGDSRAAAEAAIEQARRGAAARFTGSFETRAGRTTWWDVAITPVSGGRGDPVRLLAVSRDMTEQKRTEAHQKMLLAELDHRVKNALATVQSMAAHSLPADGASDAFLGRLSAMARAHTILSAEQWHGVQLAELMEALLAAYKAGRTRVSLDGPPAILDPKLAQSLALAVHELATNAAKYGALSTAEGRVRIAWSVLASPRRLQLSWRESDGPRVLPPAGRGFGTSFIERSLTYEFGAEVALQFHPEGLRFDATLPLLRDIA
jgi:two-component system, chemotaxis family, CheB/CheR fusion protein